MSGRTGNRDICKGVEEICQEGVVEGCEDVVGCESLRLNEDPCIAEWNVEMGSGRKTRYLSALSLNINIIF